jgi:ABC-type lipoprotein release transport system permease subunit
LVAFSVVVCTALIAAWYPARRANQLEPVTAIREG